MSNKHFENYPSVEDIDPYGVDLVHPTTHAIIANYRTYWQARDHRDNIIEENDAKKRAYLDACRQRSEIIHANQTLPADKKLTVPDIPKKPRLTAVPSLRWYAVGKAPVAETATA